MKERLHPAERSSIGILCEIDPEEVEFGHLIDDWVQDKISHKILLRNLPSHRLTVPQRALRYLLDRIT